MKENLRNNKETGQEAQEFQEIESVLAEAAIALEREDPETLSRERLHETRELAEGLLEAIQMVIGNAVGAAGVRLAELGANSTEPWLALPGGATLGIVESVKSIVARLARAERAMREVN